MPSTIYNPSDIDFETPGKRYYQVAFHLDSGWGCSLVPLTVISGRRKADATAKRPGVAFFGGTHGNEWEGQIAVKRLCRDLDPDEIWGQVILVPQLSESACIANQRVSPLDGVNMNRAFPGNARGTISYRIANFVKTNIFPRVGVVIDIHSGGDEAAFPLCTSFHPIASESQRAEIAAAACLFDTPFVFIYSSQMASGLLSDEAEAEGKVCIGGEFGYGENISRLGVRHAYEGAKNVLRHYGMLRGDVVKIDAARATRPRLMRAANLADYIPCPRDGVWEPAIEVGSDVVKNDLIGCLHDFADFTSTPKEVRAHRSGILAAMHFGAVCKKGATLYVIADEVNKM